MEPLLEYQKTFAGYRTRVLELEGQSIPILLLHGYSDSADTWRYLFDRFVQHGYRAFAVDFPGFGQAQQPKPGPYLKQLDRFTKTIVRFLEHQFHQPVLIVGNSLGGTVSLRIAQDHGLPLHGVVPLAPAGFDMPRWFNLIEREPLLTRLLRLPVPLPPGAWQSLVAQFYRSLAFAKPWSIDPRVFTTFASHYPDRQSVVDVLDLGKRVLREVKAPYRDLARIQCALTLIWGEKDQMVSIEGAQQLLRVVDHARFEAVVGCGHTPQIEATDRLFTVIEALLPNLGEA